MICPYVQNSSASIQKVIIDEKTGQEQVYVIMNCYGNMECPKEGCAVWRDGRCRYNE